MVGAQKILWNKAHTTDPGREVLITVTINIISTMVLTGNMGSLRNDLK